MKRLIQIIICVMCFVFGFNFSDVIAEQKKEIVVGKVYEFDKKNKYEISSSSEYVSSDKIETYGKFYISGNFADISINNGIPNYAVENGMITLSYEYNDALLNNEEEYHLISDSEKEIDHIKYEEKIGKGTILIQTSRDGITWYDTKQLFNAFEEVPVRKEHIYESNDIQLINGTYYRVIVVYELNKVLNEGGFLGFGKSEDTKRIAEVYEFYAYDNNAVLINTSSENRIQLGEKKRVEDYNSYGKTVDIDKDNDPHFNWDIGKFYISGHTQNGKDNTILKETGDRVCLWFALEQEDLNKCGDKEGIRVISNENTSDTELDVKDIPFGKGTLIIRKRNEDNTYEAPQIYTNFLEAVASPNADTKIYLFEEGDYEVALDYELQYDKNKIPLVDFSVFPEKVKYKIYFEFKVRNGNTMVFFKDIDNVAELMNGDCVENGFKIDYANSKYLEVYYNRSVLNGNVFDVRKNTVVSDGDVYKEEGIYNFTIKNKTTNQITEKRICIGDRDLLNKYNQFIKHGVVSEEEEGEPESNATPDPTPTIQTDEPIEEETMTKNVTNININIIVIPVLLALASIGVIVMKNQKESNDRGQ